MLVSLGFPLVDFKTIEKYTEKDKLKAVLEGDENLAKEIALRNGAEVLVKGCGIFYGEHNLFKSFDEEITL